MKNSLFLLFLLCLACNNRPTPVIIKNPSSIESKLSDQSNHLKNRKIISLNGIFGDSIAVAHQLVMLYSGSDCYTCVEEGFKIIKTIDSISKGVIMTNIISTSTNISSDQFRNNYNKYIFIDEQDLIRKELKYIYTPVILSFDSSTKVDVVYFPRKSDQQDEENMFINNYLKMHGFAQKK